ncbi:hypothetical protein CPB86DRAFT_801966 [Serendipita vermifera]|nr:hypothetical protein CPB86DRAFT_801966 [Serendipita vermifera]
MIPFGSSNPVPCAGLAIYWFRTVLRTRLGIEFCSVNNVNGGASSIEDVITKVNSKPEYPSIDSADDMIQRPGGMYPNIKDMEDVHRTLVYANLANHKVHWAMVFEKPRAQRRLSQLLPNSTHLYFVPLGNHGGSCHLKIPQLRHGPSVWQVARPQTAALAFPALLRIAASRDFAVL